MTASARERTPFGNFELRKSHLKTGPNPYKPGSADYTRFESARHFPDLAGSATLAERMTPQDLRAAQLGVAAYARDADDLRELLAALGLTDEEATS